VGAAVATVVVVEWVVVVVFVFVITAAALFHVTLSAVQPTAQESTVPT
jgi:hypothetical protein